jgi:hypothetical protein
MLVICTLNALFLRIAIAECGQYRPDIRLLACNADSNTGPVPAPRSFNPKGRSAEEYIKAIKELEAKGELGKASQEGNEAVLAFPDDERCYCLLRFIYVKAHEYTRALEISRKLIDLTKAHNFPPCGYVLNHAWILERAEGEDSAISFLDSYREECSEAEGLIILMQKAKAAGEKAPPMLD